MSEEIAVLKKQVQDLRELNRLLRLERGKMAVDICKALSEGEHPFAPYDKASVLHGLSIAVKHVNETYLTKVRG